MQIFATLLTFLFWGIADLFYKLGNQGEGNRNHLKTGIMVGLVIDVVLNPNLFSVLPVYSSIFSLTYWWLYPSLVSSLIGKLSKLASIPINASSLTP